MISTRRLGRAAHLLGAALPDRAAATLGELKGGAHKLGQTLALVADGMPPELRARMGRLFAEAEPRPWAEVAPALAALPQVEVEPTPFAAASLGQVHRGTLDGRPVAVKVLYPGVREALRADLDNLATVATPARFVGGAGAMLVGLREALLAELDLRVEADHARAMAAALAPWPRLHVAAPLLATRDVLVSELLDGPTLHRTLPPTGPGVPDRDRMAADLVAATFGPVFRAGLVNADAHPGNMLVTDRGLGLVDFGAVAPVSDVPGLIRALDARLAGRIDWEGLGIRPGALADELASVTALLGPDPWDFGRDDPLALLGEVKRRRPLALREVPFPPGRLPLVRACLGLLHALRRLGVRMSLGRELARVREAAAGR